ncbi:MAG: tetratricopeptide repeat protein [Pyrinomonadaceae bacterium]
MVFDKAKVLKAAEKFLSQGKINSAIKEYRQIVEHDADDLTTLNMLGDLYARAGKKDEAIACFQKIAEHYSNQQFNLKAIAMYKKIERLKPRDPVVAAKLGDLYAMQGLIVDARSQYLIVADAASRTGEHKKALDILHRIADLDPNNTEIRLKLAEGYLKESMRREAASAFVQAAHRLNQTGNHDKALAAYTKALQLVPDDPESVRGLLETHIARGTADDAAEILEQLVLDREDDHELVAMLARAYLAAEEPAGAERATTILMNQDPANYVELIPVARLYVKGGQLDDAVRILSGVIERMLAGREENALLELVNSVLERNPDHVAALRMLVRIHWWQRDMDALRATLERLAEAAEAMELVEDERYALTQLVRLAPDEKRYLKRLDEVGGLQDEAVDDFTISETPSSDVPEFETFSIVNENVDTAPAMAAQSAEFVSNSATEAFLDPTTSFADLNEPVAESNPSTPATQDFQEVDLEETAASFTQRIVSEDEEARLEMMMRQELESVDFYIAQSYFDIATDTLDMLERQYGPHDEITSRREKLAAQGTAAPRDVFDFTPVEAVETKPADAAEDVDMAFASFSGEPPPANGEVEITTSAAGKGIDAGLAELFEEFRAAEEQGDASHEDFETHYNMGTAYKEMGLLDEAVQEFQISATLVKPGDGTPRFLECCSMLGHCFMENGMPEAAVIWLKKGITAPGASEDQAQALRYELGLAYEQLGDNENALQQYTEVYGVDVSYREVAEKLKKRGKNKKK